MSSNAQIEKEEAIQRALGTLPSYYVSIFIDSQGLIGEYNKIIDAITPARAIYYRWMALNPGHKKRFLRVLKSSYRHCSVHIQLVGTNPSGMGGQTIENLRLILDTNGNIRENLPEEILIILKYVQNGGKSYQ